MKIIIIGGDKTAYFLTKRFIERHHTVTIIHKDMIRCQELAEQTEATVIYGDGSNVNILESAGARKADVLLAITPQDEDNLVACQVANRQYGVPRVIAIVNDPDNEQVFQQLGVTVAFSATRIIGAVLDQEASFEEITSLMPIARGKLTVNDVRLSDHSPAVGQTLAELKLPGGSLVVGVIRGDDVFIPSGSTQLLAEDHLLIVGTPESTEDDLVSLCGHPA